MSDNPTQKPHKRLIKEALRDKLLEKTEAGKRVFISQSIPSEEETIPQINIYSTGEVITILNQAPKEYERVLSIVTEVLMNGDNDDDLDENLEILADKIERLIEEDPFLNDLLSEQLQLTGSSYSTSEEGSAYLGSLVLTWELTYLEYGIRKNSACYPALKEAGIDWKVNSNTVNAQDKYNFEQGEPS